MWFSLAGVVAVATSVLGLAVAVEQLTLGTRLRRYVTFLRGTIESEKPGSAQRQVLESLYREAVARLVGTDAVPSWLLTLHGMVVVFGTYVSGVAGWGAAAARDWWTILGLAGLGVAVGAPSFAIGVRLVVQDLRIRALVERAYLRGDLPLNVGRTRARLHRHALSRRYLAAVGVAFALLSFGVGLVLGVGPRSQLPYWALQIAALVAGLFAFSAMLASGSRLAVLTQPRGIWVWQHPTRLTGRSVRAGRRGSGEAPSG